MMRQITKIENDLFDGKIDSPIETIKWLIKEVRSLEAANEALSAINENTRIMAWFGDPDKIPDGWVKIKESNDI